VKKQSLASAFLLLAASLLAPLAEASLTRSAAPRSEAPALSLTLATPEPSEFYLFDGTEIARALASRPAFDLISITTDETPTAARTRFVSPSELSTGELPDGPELVPITSVREQRFNLRIPPDIFGLEPLRGPPGNEASYPKTRYRIFGLLGTPILGELRGVSLELRWGCADFSCGLASGTVGWLSQDPVGDKDSPNLYGFVGARPHEKTDPLGLAGAPYPCGMRPCDPREQTGGEWLGENVLAPAARAYEGAWDIFLRATGGNQADREFVEIATGLGLFKGLRVAEGSAFLARRSLQGVGKALDRIPVNAREFSPSTFGVGNIQREEKAAGQIAERIGQRALPTAEDFPWSKYQRHVTGVDYEEMWRLNQKRLGVDAKTAGYTVEAKWAGKNPAAWRSSPYNPSSELYDEANILDQARRLLELNKQTSGKGVRYALSNEPSAKHFMELFEKTFPEETKAGTLKVWVVPGNGM
jgi:hypothetical protein